MYGSKKKILKFGILFSAVGGIILGIISAAVFSCAVITLSGIILGIALGQALFWLLSVSRFLNKKGTSSVLETINVNTGDIKTVFRFENQIIESPNVLPDGKSIVYNSCGELFKIDIETKNIEKIFTGNLSTLNNDHIISPDGKNYGISANKSRFFGSRIYIVNPDEKTVFPVVTKTDSYLHGWSPDGKTLAYCAKRNGQYNIFSCSVSGGAENQLTDSKGHNDGCEYSPDGKHIWYNSAVNGLMAIWRMDSDGENKRRMTFEECNAWFPHISPDGKSVAYLTFKKDDILPEEHLPKKHVKICVMNYDGTESRILTELYGGQGTLNTNSWSPDGESIAYVKYD